DRDDDSSNGNCAAPDSSAPPAEEAKGKADTKADTKADDKADADATGQGDTPADVAEGAVEAVAAGANAPATGAAAASDVTDEDAAMPADERIARGRRWAASAAEPAGEQGKTARNGVGR